jgi:drug/metabolite transporter (DMT)-like permease
MHTPPIFFEPQFVSNIIAGWLLLLLGAAVLLLAAVWMVWANEWADRERKPSAWRGLCAIGFGLFVVGFLWQVIGYARVGVLDW